MQKTALSDKRIIFAPRSKRTSTPFPAVVSDLFPRGGSLIARIAPANIDGGIAVDGKRWRRKRSARAYYDEVAVPIKKVSPLFFGSGRK